MSKSSKKIIAVAGATGAQGGGVLRALQEHGGYVVRALTRDPVKAAGLADEVVEADFDRPETLRRAFEGVYGVFANTNSFAAPDTDEIAQGKAMVDAAKGAGVTHFIWSTLPNVAEISGGTFQVPHFTNKAKVDEFVEAAGFKFLTFVEPPFYFQNLVSPMYPKHDGPDGTPTWGQPMRGGSRGVHMGDISELGHLVVGALERPEQAGAGQHLSLAGDLLSWDEVIAVLRRQGHNIAFEEVPSEDWDNQGPWAPSVREMFSYFEAHTCFGPDATSKIDLASAITTKPFTSFDAWAAANMPVTG